MYYTHLHVKVVRFGGQLRAHIDCLGDHKDTHRNSAHLGWGVWEQVRISWARPFNRFPDVILLTDEFKTMGHSRKITHIAGAKF